MARKAARRAPSSSTKIIRAAAPIIKVSTPRPMKAPKKRRGGRRHGGGGLLGGGSSIQSKMIAGAIGGFLLGYIDKNFPNLPHIPVAGKAGTIAIGAYVIGKTTRMKVAFDVAYAAATVTGYEFGFSGKVSGDGIATQT